MKEWTNAKGSGKLFSFTVTDDSCDIRITAFNDEVDKFFNLVEANKVRIHLSIKYIINVGFYYKISLF